VGLSTNVDPVPVAFLPIVLDAVSLQAIPVSTHGLGFLAKVHSVNGVLNYRVVQKEIICVLMTDRNACFPASGNEIALEGAVLHPPAEEEAHSATVYNVTLPDLRALTTAAWM